jgi:hypothetical protein
MTVVIEGQHAKARFAQSRLLARSEIVTIEHGHARIGLEHSIHDGIRKLAGRQCFQQKALATDALLDCGRTFRQQKRCSAAGTLPALPERQAAHDMTGSDLNSTFGADDEVPGLIQAWISSVLTREP